ncbi:hypothetical protein BS17DRAFT_448174 [Gyrodon lividus]|nr:hypothetical protein BS17DRAFT_448174 [Gyrodon lividus]
MYAVWLPARVYLFCISHFLREHLGQVVLRVHFTRCVACVLGLDCCIIHFGCSTCLFSRKASVKPCGISNHHLTQGISSENKIFRVQASWCVLSDVFCARIPKSSCGRLRSCHRPAHRNCKLLNSAGTGFAVFSNSMSSCIPVPSQGARYVQTIPNRL